MTTVLVADDEPNLVELMREYLERAGFRVLTAADGESALTQARDAAPDVVLLDVMLPNLDGFEVCRRLRRFSDAYVLMLTARSEEVDKIVGLSVGADDYVTKPFSPREVVARVQAMLRRPRPGAGGPLEPVEPPVRRFGTVTIDEAAHEVTRCGEIIPLTAREFALLVTLARHPHRVFTRAQLLRLVWGDEFYDDHVVDVHVGNLRKKLEREAAQPQLIETIRGVGYRFAPRAG